MSSPSVQTSASVSPSMLPIGAVVLSKNVRLVDLETPKGRALVESIREHGIVQPLLVRRLAQPQDSQRTYQLVAGFRRWFAAAELKLPTVPVMIREMSDADVLKLQLVENLQREDMTPLDEAEALCRLNTELGLSVEEIQAQIYGQTGKKVSRSSVYNTMNLAKLTDACKEALRSGKLSRSAAVKLLTFDRELQDQGLQIALAFEGSIAELEGQLDEQLKSRAEKEKRWQKLAEAATAKGQPVMPADECAAAFECNENGHCWLKRDGLFLRPDEDCRLAASKNGWQFPSWGSLLEKSTVPLTLVQTPGGDAMELYERRAAMKWLKDSGVLQKAKQAEEQKKEKKAAKADPALEKWQEKYGKVTEERQQQFDVQLCATLAAAIAQLAPEQAIRWLASQQDSYYARQRRQLDQRAADAWIKKASAGELLAYILEAEWVGWRADYPVKERDPLHSALLMGKVDQESIWQGIIAKLPLPEKPAPVKATAKPATSKLKGKQAATKGGKK